MSIGFGGPMSFTSLAFGLFLPIVFIIYWALPHRFRWIMLLAASLYFYMCAGPKYVVLILITSFVTWGAALLVGSTEDKKKRKLFIVLALVICLGILSFFKYFNFACGSVAALMQMFSIQLHPATLKIVLPVGISFYTFQSLGYAIDVYRGKIEPEKNYLKYTLFVSFFPQIMAGPIGRADQLMPQLFSEKKFDYDMASEGLRQMLWGFFKKLIIADTLVKYVDVIFDNVTYYFGLTLIMATVMFTFEIYCDFSGYSDIAIGTAKLLNINLMTNFKSPYYSRSVREFWSRWHISLSTWFRDYLYIPLGGNRCSEARNSFNVMVTFLFSGLWHGADWTYVIWGGLHGVYQVVENFCHKHLAKKEYRTMKERDIKRSVPWNICHGILTFGLVSYAWSYFRANSTSDAIYIALHMPRGLGHPANSYLMMLNNMFLDNKKLLVIAAYIVILMAVDFFALKHDLFRSFGKLKMPLRWIIYVSLTVFIIVMKLHNGTTQELIYFQF